MKLFISLLLYTIYIYKATAISMWSILKIMDNDRFFIIRISKCKLLTSSTISHLCSSKRHCKYLLKTADGEAVNLRMQSINITYDISGCYVSHGMFIILSHTSSSCCCMHNFWQRYQSWWFERKGGVVNLSAVTNFTSTIVLSLKRFFYM